MRFHRSIQCSVSTFASLWPWVLGFSTLTATIHKIRCSLGTCSKRCLFVRKSNQYVMVVLIFNSMSLFDMNLVQVGRIRMRNINISKNISSFIHVYPVGEPFEYGFLKDSLHFGCRDLVYAPEVCPT